MNRNCILVITSIIIVIVLASGAIACAEDGKIWQFGMKYYVHIMNGFKKSWLIVHCRSKQNDLGKHSIKGGQEISWHFKVNFDGSTLFYCDVRRGEQTKHFDAFRGVIEGTKCNKGQCYWLVTEEGFFFSSDNVTWWNKFGWSSWHFILLNFNYWNNVISFSFS